MSNGQARQSDGQAYIRPASDDSVPLREHLERLIGEQKHRFDDLRTADKTALDAALASADKAVQAALLAQRADGVRADIVMEKRFNELNDMRRAVATSAEVDALRAIVSAMQRALDKLESKVDSNTASMAGRAGGLKDYIGWIVAAVAIAGTLASLLLRR